MKDIEKYDKELRAEIDKCERLIGIDVQDALINHYCKGEHSMNMRKAFYEDYFLDEDLSDYKEVTDDLEKAFIEKENKDFEKYEKDISIGELP